jgi:hypothetical protein
MLQPYRDNEFFSGAQARVYFGHILVDDVTSIEWRGNSTKRPVYGYASEQFDAVSKGQYIIQGAFMIPFKEVGYLHAVMAAMKDGQRGREYVENALSGVKRNGQKKFDAIRALPIDPSRNPGMRITTTPKTNNVGEDEAAITVTSLTANQVLTEAADQGGRSFKDLTDQFENAIWNQNKTKEDRLPRADEFDIFNGPNGRRFIENGFNIMMTFGDVNNSKAPSTVKSIIDVHITSDERILDSTGQPIYERYSFFARGADESVGQYSFTPSITTRKGPGSSTVPINQNQDDGTTEAYEPELVEGITVEAFRDAPILITDENGSTTFRGGYEEIENYLNGITKLVPPDISRKTYVLQAMPRGPTRIHPKLKEYTRDQPALYQELMFGTFTPSMGDQEYLATRLQIIGQATIADCMRFVLMRDNWLSAEMRQVSSVKRWIFDGGQLELDEGAHQERKTYFQTPGL